MPSPGRSTTRGGLPVGKRSLLDPARLAAARPRAEPRRLHRVVPASEHARDGLARRMVIAGLIPLARQRRAAALAVPGRELVDDRLVRPAEPPPRAFVHR